jgi:hypothetical protein
MKTYSHIYLFIIIIIIIFNFNFLNKNIILGFVHSLGGHQVPPSNFATDTFLPQFSHLPEKVEAIYFETLNFFVGMFTGRVCLSLMARTTTMTVCLHARKEEMMENRESISSGEEVNSMKIKY